MVLVTVNSAVLKLIQSYKKWVTENPQLISDIESTIKCLSYFTAARFNNSTLASELIYSMPNLLVLLNDLLMYSGKFVNLKLSQFESKIKVWLTVIEYVEALFEVTAKRIGGEKGRWLTIVVVQILKTVMRLLLVHVYKERIVQNPPIAPLNRDKLKDKLKDSNGTTSAPEGFKLKRSGLIIRSIRASAPPNVRTWAPLTPMTNEYFLTDEELNKTRKSLLLAETLYIIKPLLHLGCVSFGGPKHWKPWMLSFVIDLISLKLFNKTEETITLTNEEKVELCRRKISLFMYILRSPFYDNYSRVRVLALLGTLSRRVPLARFITEPVVKYLPHWQEMYFYMWSC